MPFTDAVVLKAWERAGSQCECIEESHDHLWGRCSIWLIPAARGRTGRSAWDVYRLHDSGGYALSNCEALCWICRKRAS